MNTLKTLQMVLTTLLLVLAILALHWQEGVGQKSRVADGDPKEEAAPVKEPVYADCCLQHALQAAEGGDTFTGQIHLKHVEQVFQLGTLMLLEADSARHIAASLN
ncbi:hypothetical protein [Pontibacter kalidii]|uniref:hypothetical protein n=1 Tax=Pontibacter kalidii TaxID=2592049 RepID=UPI00225A0DA0|nr:hypothetical protein [Pontibacter kalidii]